MIVDPDFPDHWKTRLLVGELDGDEAAPTYMLRIWGHCQNRRQWIFEGITSQALKALCRYPGEASKLEKALVDTGFVKREGTKLVIVHWDVYNAALIASWENGKRGGRPRKDAVSGDVEKPSDNPRAPDRRRGEKIGEEKISNRERPDRRVREDLSPPIDQSQLEISGRGEETKAAERTKPPALPRGEPLDLSHVDWVHVTNMAVALGKRVPPLSENDRRAWLRYAVMADQVLSEDWLMESAESVVLAKVRKGKPTAHLVAILKDRAEAAGIDNETFIGIQRRIEIPKELWKSDVLPVQSRPMVGAQTR